MRLDGAVSGESSMFSGRIELVSDFLKCRSQVQPANAAGEFCAITEKHGLEFVHHNVGNEPLGIEVVAHAVGDVG